MKEFILSVANVRQLQARPPETQILVMQSKIIEAIKLTDGNIAVSYSGGKESGFLLYHVAQIWKETYGRSRNLVAIFANTGCEFKTMWPFIQHFVEWLQERFDICIDLRTVSAKQPFSKTIKTIGYPFPSKKQARMISDVRKQMRDLGVTYEDICHHIRGGIRGADAMREMGFSDTVVCDVTGIKSDNEPGTCVISRRWAPLIYAPFEVTKECCPIHKTGPIHELEKTLGNLQPMIGEMAENSQTRMNSYRQTGCNMFKDGVGVSKPMGPMTGQTVAWYYHTAGIPLAPPYGEPLLVDGYYKYSGEQNTGCKLCGFGIMYDWDRFDRLKAIEPETVRWAFKPIADGGLSYGEVCRFINTDCRGKIVIPKT